MTRFRRWGISRCLCKDLSCLFLSTLQLCYVWQHADFACFLLLLPVLVVVALFMKNKREKRSRLTITSVVMKLRRWSARKCKSRLASVWCNDYMFVEQDTAAYKNTRRVDCETFTLLPTNVSFDTQRALSHYSIELQIKVRTTIDLVQWHCESFLFFSGS